MILPLRIILPVARWSDRISNQVLGQSVTDNQVHGTNFQTVEHLKKLQKIYSWSFGQEDYWFLGQKVSQSFVLMLIWLLRQLENWLVREPAGQSFTFFVVQLIHQLVNESFL